MFLPIGDEPNPPGTPFFTYTLIALNVLVFLLVSVPQMWQPANPQDPAYQDYLDVVGPSLPPGMSTSQLERQMSAYDLFVFHYGYRPSEPSLVTLFTSMFLHAGLLHLLGNMLFLWIYGDNVEHRLGGIQFVVWYLVTGAAATLFHAAFASGSPIPLVGASGAISGVLGFYFMWFPRNRVRVLLFLIFIVRVIVLPSRLVLGFYIIFSNIVPFLVTQSQGGGGVAHGAHIGGFFAGLAVAFVMDRRNMFSRPKEYRTARRSARPRTSPLTTGDAIAHAVENGNFDEAAKLYFQVPAPRTRRLIEPDVSIELGNWLAHHGHARAALTVFQRQLRDFPGGLSAAEAHANAGLLQLHAFDEPTAAYQHLVEALDYAPSRALAATIREALGEIDAQQKSQVGRVH